MSYLADHFENVDCDVYGNVYKNGILANQYNSNKYKQVTLKDKAGKSKIYGVHCVVAMKYLDYFDGCVVHHKDGDRSNNCLENLEVLSRKAHLQYHCMQNEKFIRANKGKHAWNYGKKMSKDFCEKCRISAKNRKDRKFHDSQCIDEFGTD